MALILGLDCATKTGWALVDRPGQMRAARCGVWEVEDKTFAEDKAAQLGAHLIALLKDNKVDFAAIEMPIRSVVMHKKKPAGGKSKNFYRPMSKAEVEQQASENTINPNALQLTGIACTMASIIDAMKVPWGLIAVQSWRAKYFQQGFVPPRKIVMDRTTGLPKDEGEDWKQAAVDYAKREGVGLPNSVEARRDAAEAVGIAVCWQSCTQVPTRHKAALQALISRQPKQQPELL